MNDSQETNKAQSFVEHWLQAFTRIIKRFGKKGVSSNTEFVNEVLADEIAAAQTQDELDIIEEKRRLMVELCDDVDTYHRLHAAAEQAPDLEQWFTGEINSLVHDVIPDANEDDVKEIEEVVSQSMDDEIKARATILESEFTPDESISDDENHLNTTDHE